MNTATRDKIIARMTAARAEIGNGYTFEGVRVTFDAFDSTYGGAWLRADCPDCGACSVGRTVPGATEVHARYLAFTLRRYSCNHVSRGMSA